MTINIKGHLLDLSIPRIMGILNLTPDSFYDGGKYPSTEAVLRQAEKMWLEGADLIDIGGMSSRPGAEIISAEEELERVLPPVKHILQQFPKAVISVDTIHAKTADSCLSAGAHIINDISAGRYDEEMLSIVSKHQAPLVLMHMQGMPANMQLNPSYTNITTEVIDFFAERIATCRLAGVNDLIIDPGFGFGKNTRHNFSLLRNLVYFKQLGVPVLAGLSRKNMIYKTLGIGSHEALNGTTVANTIALLNGANILRVHDVKEAKQAIQLVEKLRESYHEAPQEKYSA